MTWPLIIRVEAEAELGEEAGWYEQRRPGLGSDFVDAIESALAAIVEAPEAYPRWQAGSPYRKYVLRRFPFVVFFTFDGSAVRVVAFAHSKRQPGYWLNRVPR